MSTNTWRGLDSIVPQAVQAGPTAEVNGVDQPDYLKENTHGQVDIEGATTEVVLAAADGIDAGGIDSQVVRVNADSSPANWDDLINHGKEYLYANLADPASISYDKTRVPHQRGASFNEKYHSLLHFEETVPIDEYGNTWVPVGCRRSDSQAKFGTYSYSFDGSNDYLETTDIKSFQMPFTLECFWQTNDYTLATDQMIFHLSNAGGYGLALKYDGATDKLQFYLSVNGSSWVVSAGTGADNTWANNTWYHICLEWDGSFYRAYKDGVLDYSVANSDAPLSTATSVGLKFRIGVDGSGAQPIDGYVDEFRLTLGNVRYGNAFTVPTAAFIPDALWFDTKEMRMKKGTPGQERTIYHSLCHLETETTPEDEYDHTWEVLGDPARSAVQQKFGSYSWLFDTNADGIWYKGPIDFDVPWCIEGYWHPTDVTASVYVMGTEVLYGIMLNFRGDTDDKIDYYLGNGAAWTIANNGQGSNALSVDTWHHIVLEWDGGEYRAYIDGTLDFASQNTAAVCTTNSHKGMQFGNYHSYASPCWIGYIDEIRMTFGKVRYGMAGFAAPAAAFDTEASDPETETVRESGWVDKVYLPLGYALNDRRGGALMHFEADADSNDWWDLIDDYGNKWTFGGTAKLDTDDNGGGNIAPKIGSRLLWSTAGYIQSAEITTLGIGPWTLETWWYTSNEANATQTIFANSTNLPFGIWYDGGNNKFETWLSSTGAAWDIASGTQSNAVTVVNYTWYHIAYVFDGMTYKLYFDGALVMTITDNAVIDDFTALTLGMWNGGSYSPGGFDDFRFTRGKARYTADFSASLPTTAHSADGCIKYLVMPPYRDEPYEPGWVYRTDWSGEMFGYDRYNHVQDSDEDLEHGLARDLKDLSMEIYYSETGSFNDSVDPIIFHQVGSGTQYSGHSIAQVDLDRVAPWSMTNQGPAFRKASGTQDGINSAWYSYIRIRPQN